MMKGIKTVVLTICAGFLLSFSFAQAQWGGVTGVTGVVLPGTTGALEAADDVLVVQTIQNAINRVLGILAFVALIILLYAGLLMLTAAGNEDRFNKGRTILKQVALGLAFIGLAWIIVSMIFWLIDQIT